MLVNNDQNGRHLKILKGKKKIFNLRTILLNQYQIFQTKKQFLKIVVILHASCIMLIT